jgi:hypothetical protein
MKRIYDMHSEAVDMEGFLKTFVLCIAMLFIGFGFGVLATVSIISNNQPLAIEAARNTFNKLNGLQQISFMHDRMQLQEVRWVWRQTYCGKELPPMDSIRSVK